MSKTPPSNGYSFAKAPADRWGEVGHAARRHHPQGGRFHRQEPLDGQKLDTLSRIAKLDEFLKLSGHELPDHTGGISPEPAERKAGLEYEHYRWFLDSQPRPAELDFEKATAELKKLPKPKKPATPKK